MPPPLFWENSESFGQERNVEQEIFEALQCGAIMGEGIKETLRGFWKQFSPPTPTFVIISDYEEEEQVEKKNYKGRRSWTTCEVEQLVDFSSALVKGGFFDIEFDSLDIPIIVPTKAWSKYMMRHKWWALTKAKK